MSVVHPVAKTHKIDASSKQIDLMKRLLKMRIPHRFWRLPNFDCLRRDKGKSNGNGSFHEAIGSILALAQFFAIMPVIGVRSNSVAKLEFRWGSIRTIYAMIMLAMLTCYTGLTVYIVQKHEINFEAFIPIVFYGSNIYAMFRFISIAQKWPGLMHHWESVDSKLPKWRSEREKGKLAIQIKMTATVVLLCSLVEHILNIYSVLHYSINCLNHPDPIRNLAEVQLSQLFEVTEYTPLKGVFGKVLNIVATFSWTYMDLFVILVSIGLSSRFKQINRELERVRGEHMSEDYWELRRSQYRKLANLCVTVDQTISNVTLLSFSNNLFFICIQLMHSLRRMPSFAHALYFWFSLIFLITRTLAVSLYAAEIYDESKKPINVLRSVPHTSWCTEVQRFSEEVVNGTVALSGMQFFYLTRRHLLSVAGTIVTYELVLYQLNDGGEKAKAAPTCPAMNAQN